MVPARVSRPDRPRADGRRADRPISPIASATSGSGWSIGCWATSTPTSTRRNWTTIWTNLLIGRTGGMERRSLVDRAGMQQYLREAFQYNKPYDELAQELITATGSCRPGDEDFNGAANFLVDKMDEGGVQATAKTSQIFLGMAVQCTQCHNHPFNEYKQNQFWELNAFFRQTRRRADRGGRRPVRRRPRGGPRFSRRDGRPEEGRHLLRAAQRQDEGGVPGVRRRHVAGGDVRRAGRGLRRPRAAWPTSTAARSWRS